MRTFRNLSYALIFLATICLFCLISFSQAHESMLVFTLLGKFCHCEMHTYTGRIDCSVQTQDYIYLFEFKRDSSAAEALAQINSKEYSLPFIADSRTLYKIGVSFDSESRKLTDWAVDTDD